MSKGRTVLIIRLWQETMQKKRIRNSADRKETVEVSFSMGERLYGIAERFVRIRQIGEAPFI